MCLVKRRRNLNVWKKAATCVFCIKGTKSHVTYQKTGKLHVCLLVFRCPLPIVGSMLLVTSTDWFKFNMSPNMVNSQNEYPFLEGEIRYNWESVVPGKNFCFLLFAGLCSGCTFALRRLGNLGSIFSHKTHITGTLAFTGSELWALYCLSQCTALISTSACCGFVEQYESRW